MNEFSDQITKKTAHFLSSVYAWMTVGLASTSLTSYLLAHSISWQRFIITYPFALWAIFVAQIIVVISFSASIQKMSYNTALIFFLGYALLTGTALSSLFQIYSSSSLTNTFLTVSIMFAGMALYGSFTQRDLSSWGPLLSMALWGLIVALIVNIFIYSTTIDLITSFFGVIIFTLLTAFDVQKLKNLLQSSSTFSSEKQRILSLWGALILYLDFVNLFLNMIRFTGSRRE
jgi:uncharacterized protein